MQELELNRSILDGSNALAYDPRTVESDSNLREKMKVTSSLLAML